MNSQIARTKIDYKVVYQLWGKSAGRCELCNIPVYIDPTFGVDGIFAENAHICGVGENGPRHKNSMTQDDINRIENLMLLCPDCHKLIDSSPENYGENYLISRKRGHEERVYRVTDIRDDQTCRMATYFVNIDNQKQVFDERLFKEALVSAKRVPLQHSVMELHDSSDMSYSATPVGFAQKADALSRNFRDMFSRIHDNESVAVFAFAPQPLLIKLGTLINDQYNVIAFQCHREGHKWAWKDDARVPKFLRKTTKESPSNKVALVIDLSATVEDSRITAILGNDTTVHHLTIKRPDRNFVTNSDVQDAFINTIRPFIEDIKNSMLHHDVLHVFPVMPTSLNVRLGMDYMPKADLPWVIYEQANATDGFFAALTIGGIQS